MEKAASYMSVSENDGVDGFSALSITRMDSDNAALRGMPHMISYKDQYRPVWMRYLDFFEPSDL